MAKKIKLQSIGQRLAIFGQLLLQNLVTLVHANDAGPEFSVTRSGDLSPFGLLNNIVPIAACLGPFSQKLGDFSLKTFGHTGFN